jgi:hypothetical protein
MTSSDLPAELKAALEAKLHGLSRSDVAERSARISETYRAGGSSAAIRTEADALAYALARTAPDWCHFTQRLPRSRAHRQLKGAELAFEDEKFAYVALTRAAVARRPARVLAQPVATKVEVTAKLCASDGLVFAKVPRRAKADYARARRWGDAAMEEA